MAITPPTPQTMVNATTWGKPITDEVNRMTPLVVAPTAWVNFTLTNSWTNDSGAPPAGYRKVNDIVYLRGSVSGGGSNTSLGTLPVGFRPPTQVNFIAFSYTNGVEFTHVFVTAAGAVSINASIPAPRTVSLAQVFFPIV